jgi:hypothetical protein
LAEFVAVRLNTHAGVSETVLIPTGLWIQHSVSDVAVVPWGPDQTHIKFRALGVVSVATESIVADKAIGPGDDVFVTGLLVHHPGQTRIMPIVRLGCIAAIPDDPVKLQLGKHIGAPIIDEKVVLVEARSIGGISGSPVFVHLPFWRDIAIPPGGGALTFTGSGDVKAYSGGEHWLLGVMHGFYPVGVNDPDGVSAGNTALNTGIAVVTPADRMMDIINGPELSKKREEMCVELEKGQMPIPTSASQGLGSTADLCDK